VTQYFWSNPVESLRGARPPYVKWQQRYSGEDFDRAQAFAVELTDQDRAAGRSAPRAGYSAERFREAEGIVRAARR
jgi:hypothetical protein